jgi:hypothetical protein
VRAGWRAQIQDPTTAGELRFDITRHDGEGTIVARALYLAELATRAPTLDAQAEVLGTWLTASLRFLAEHPPPRPR